MFSNLLDSIKNNTLYVNKYSTHNEAVIISCYFNPKKSPYRLKAFNAFYDSIKHLNHRIVECVIGDTKPQLEENENISRVYCKTLLWHKEALLNKLIKELPKKYKYVFWVDADVLFSNPHWVVDGVKELQTAKILQPFEYCIHMNQDQMDPPNDHKKYADMSTPNKENKRVWRSFCANYATETLWRNPDYNTHGHVGFAWGARREVLDAVPLYDRAFVGGADHIIAHAAAGQIGFSCITKAFTENIEEVNQWSEDFSDVVRGKISYVKGGLFHIWHGEIEKRQYLKRIKEFTPTTKTITHKDRNGLYVAHNGEDQYVDKYFDNREVRDDSFLTSLAVAYATDNSLIGTMVGGNPMGAMFGDMMNTNDQVQPEIQPECISVDQNTGTCMDEDPFS